MSVNTITWENGLVRSIFSTDARAMHIRQRVIDVVWQTLRETDKTLILEGMIDIINLLMMRYDPDLWSQLIQNNNQDLFAIMSMLLPFIKDDNLRKDVKTLEELYLTRDAKGNFLYTNSQYNRCRRSMGDDGQIKITFRPYLREYFLQNKRLLLASINQCANKLYVNWGDVVPMTMDEYETGPLFQATVAKLQVAQMPDLVDGYHDMYPGLTFQDIYDVIANYLYLGLRKYRWVMYDVSDNGQVKTYLEHLETFIDLQPIWSGLTYDQLSPLQSVTFKDQWSSFLSAPSPATRVVLSKIVGFMSRYHEDVQDLIQSGLLRQFTDQELEEGEVKTTVLDALRQIPVSRVYSFLYEQLTEFKGTWFYYTTKITKREYPSQNIQGVTLRVTPKIFYNLAKSLTHADFEGKYQMAANHWQSLHPSMINVFLVRLLDIQTPENDWTKNSWFDRSQYFKLVYPNVSRRAYPQLNKALFDMIRVHLPHVIFEIMIIKGLLSKYVPSPQITNDAIAGQGVDATDLVTITAKKQRAAYDTWFQTNKYDKGSYYWLTGTTYDKLTVNGKRWFDQIGFNREQDWIFTYAMNWISQLNFFHHFNHTRVMYVTGSTGVGKSTQVPKLAMYAKYMLQYVKPKVICTQPRIDPTTLNAKIVSSQLGVPIVELDKQTANYYVQYEYEGNAHSRKNASFLRFVTDGKLYVQMQAYPFLAKTSQAEQPEPYMYTTESDNIYDVVIVDEAHEHNTNMDLILTLARDAVYINNNVTLIIVSATMDDDEPIYRRYYRPVNDNRSYPLNMMISQNQLDRVNVDRRVHINPPGKTTRHQIITHYLTAKEAEQITPDTYLTDGIQFTLSVIEKTTKGDLLLFVAKVSDVTEAVKQINENTTPDILALPFYGDMTENQKEIVRKIHLHLPNITRIKEDAITQTNARRVQPKTYKRAVIVATNIAEASISLPNLEYVIDTGYINTVIYDPLNDVKRATVVPISNTSSEQRRGRVGRVRPGTVYFRYNKAKVENNKTSYKIADDDVKYTILGLTQSDPRDSPIINSMNDINNIQVIDEMRYDIQYDSESPLSSYVNNPMPYLDLIYKQYRFFPMDTIYAFYTYYGVTDNQSYPNLNDRQYWLQNHDDYDYQRKHSRFRSACYTGYTSQHLIDRDAQFYLIHPDENVFIRDMFTGKVKALQDSPLVTAGYYHLLLTENDAFNPGTGKAIEKINFDQFRFLKVYFAYLYLSTNLFAIGFYSNEYDHVVKYPRSNPLWDKDIANYFRQYNLEKVYLYRQSSIFQKLEGLYRAVSYKNITNYEDIMWYAYSMGHGVQDTVLAMILFLQAAPSLSSWFANDPKKTQSVLAQLNNKSDLYFFYDLWRQLSRVLPPNTFDLQALQEEFLDVKTRYQSGLNVSAQQKLILDDLSKKGRIDFTDYLQRNRQSVAMTSTIRNRVEAIAKANGLDPKLVQRTVARILQIRYEINVNLTTNPPDGLSWILSQMKLPSIIPQPSEWDLILQQYIRAYSANLVHSNYHSYTGILTGLPIELTPWPRVLPEKTLIQAVPRYLIYHSIDASDNTIQFLTPVPIEWYVRLNPLLSNKVNRLLMNTGKLTDDQLNLGQYMGILRNYTRNFNNYDYVQFMEKLIA